MEESGWLSTEELVVFRSFSQLARRLFVTFDQELQQDVGMPRTYFEILWLLSKAPERSVRMSDLATATGSQPSRISHAVWRLESAGLVQRELCVDDRRGRFTVLTDAGEAALEVVAPRYARSIREHFLAPLSPSEREQLVSIAQKVLAELGPPAVEVAPLTSVAAPASRVRGANRSTTR